MAGQRNNYGKRSHSHSDYSENGRSKRRNQGEDKSQFSIGPEDTVYRYLCPGKKIGRILGSGGETIKQLRLESKSRIRIGETVSGCDERVVTIYSSGDETNDFDGSDDQVCPAQDALFRIHDGVVADDLDVDEDSEDAPKVTARLLVSKDQTGSIIGKGGQTVQDVRSDTGAQIRIMKDHHLPHCALNNDELVQISGTISVVRKALFRIATRLHDNPSKSQHLLASSAPNTYASSGSLTGTNTGPPIMGLTPPVGHYGGYKGESGDWQRSSSREFSLRMICLTETIGGVIGKGGVIINQIRQESGATIKVNSSASEGDDCIISVSAREVFEDTFSPTIEAALRLQPRCSEKAKRDSGLMSFTTRLLVPNSRISCLIGKGGAIISEIRRITKANIRIISKENLPKVAEKDDEMVQISGDLDLAKDALLQVASRLRANLFGREGTMSAFVPVLSSDRTDGSKYESREPKGHSKSPPYSGVYSGSRESPTAHPYGIYRVLQSGGISDTYGDYYHSPSPPRRRKYDY